MMLSIILVAFCLRIIITGVGPLLPEITESLGLFRQRFRAAYHPAAYAFAVVSPLTGGSAAAWGRAEPSLSAVPYPAGHRA